jgi:very-short-patch-repair endonuclease
MIEYNYNLSEQLDHIAYMLNVRTKRKAYENFIVNAIYTKVGNSELMPVTQQYVRNPNDPRGYYLLDLYFPQINFGVEIDEGYHCNEENQLKDKEREEAIKCAIKCDEERIAIFTKDLSGGWRKRSYNEICADIDRIVSQIKERIDALPNGLEWETNDEKIEKVTKCGVFDVDDCVTYKTITEIYNICGGSRSTGMKVSGLQRACLRLNSEYYLWVPTLAIKTSGGYDSKYDYHNLLSEDKTVITERSLKKPFKESNHCTTPQACNSCKKCNTPSTYRVVFLRTRDIFCKPSIKFIGVFKLLRYINANEREFIRVATDVKIDNLRQ